MANFPLPKGYQRLGKFPIDETEVFTSLSGATAYALSPSAYAGQKVSVVDTSGNTSDVYVILPDGALGAVGGSGVVLLIEKTYSELAALIATSGLTAGQQYLLTDYQTKHLISNSDPQVINTGSIEPLILTAVNTQEFHTEVKSTIYPTDIIHYRFDDDSCEDGVRNIGLKKWEGGTSRNGFIIYRKDTINILSTHYDWRNYKVRRWKLNANTFVPSTSYSARNVVEYNNNIYVANKTTALATVPSSDKVNWIKIISLGDQSTYGSFLSPTPYSSNLNYGNVNTMNFIINNDTIGVDYNDFYTFTLLDDMTNSSGIVKTDIDGQIGMGYFNIEIGIFDYDYYTEKISYDNTLQSNVFFCEVNYYAEFLVRNIKIGSNSTNNTIGTNVMNGNNIGSEFHDNIIGEYFKDNNIGNNFSKNFIYSGFEANSIKNDFKNNSIGYSFYNNILSNNFLTNLVNESFYKNEIYGSFDSSIIGTNNYNNSFYTVGGVTTLNNFRFNFITDSIAINFTTATLVYGAYTKKIFKNSAGTLRLMYYNTSDQIIINNINA